MGSYGRKTSLISLSRDLGHFQTVVLVRWSLFDYRYPPGTKSMPLPISPLRWVRLKTVPLEKLGHHSGLLFLPRENLGAGVSSVCSVLSQLERLWQTDSTKFLLTGPQRRKSMLDPTNILKGKTKGSALASPQKISGITCGVNFFPPQGEGSNWGFSSAWSVVSQEDSVLLKASPNYHLCSDWFPGI